MNSGEDRFRELCAGHVLGTLSEDEMWAFDALLENATPEMLIFHNDLEFAALHLPAGAQLVAPRPEVKLGLLRAIRADRQTAGRSLALRPPLAIAAIAALFSVSIGLGWAVSSLSRAVDTAESRADRLVEEMAKDEGLLEVLRSKEVDVVILEGLDRNPQGYGKLIWDRENQVALLQVANLPPVLEDHVYQLWVFAQDRDPASAGVFAVNEVEGEDFFRFEGFHPGERELIKGFLITLEPKGGAIVPSDTRYLGGRLAS